MGLLSMIKCGAKQEDGDEERDQFDSSRISTGSLANRRNSDSKHTIGSNRKSFRISFSSGPTRYSTDTGRLSLSTAHSERTSHNSLYPFPMTLAEQDRLQTQHYLDNHIWKGDFSAPIEEILQSGARVLDVGCGPGTWCLEMASKYTGSKFHGVDIVRVFPQWIKPANLIFHQADILNELEFENDYFDFVHVRDLGIAFTQQQWRDEVIPELVRVLKPNGWIELSEMTIPNTFGPNSTAFFELWKSGLYSRDADLNIGAQLPDLLSDQLPASDVQHEIRDIKVGDWGELVGKLTQTDMIEVMRMIGPTIGLDEQMLSDSIENFKDECEAYAHQINRHRIYAQKVAC